MCNHHLCFGQQQEKYVNFSTNCFQFLQLQKHRYITRACFRNDLIMLVCCVSQSSSPSLDDSILTRGKRRQHQRPTLLSILKYCRNRKHSTVFGKADLNVLSGRTLLVTASALLHYSRI